MTPSPYTPATVASIKTAAAAGRTKEEIAESLGWDIEQLSRVARLHGIEFTFKAEAADFPEIPEPRFRPRESTDTCYISVYLPPPRGVAFRKLAESLGLKRGALARRIIAGAMARGIVPQLIE
jgi:hypothetical protein